MNPMVNTVLSAIGGAGLTAAVTLWIDGRRNTRDALKLHHTEIKDKVLQPIIELTEGFYDSCFSKNEIPVEKHSHLWDCSIRDPQHEFSYQQPFGMGTTPGYYRHRGFEESVLFRDSLKHHFPDLLSDWLKLRDGYLKYANAVVEIVQADRANLEAVLGIPARTPTSDPKPGLNYNSLAFALLARRFGLTDRKIQLNEGMYSYEIRLWTQDSIGTIQTSDLKRFTDTWEKLPASNELVDDLKATNSKKYAPLAKSILERARVAKESHRSLSKCDLT